MRSILGAVSTSTQPPLQIPLGHVLVGLCFLVAGGVLAVTIAGSAGPASGRVAAVHLLLVGWVCLTILGAMTQFVPVWSGVELHSIRLAILQLVLVTGGLVGVASGFLVETDESMIWFAFVLFAGFCVFCYNVGRTLWSVRPWDVTEGHFALALGFFVVATALGTSLVVDYRFGVYPVGSSLGWVGGLPVTRVSAIDAHVTLAVFGGVGTTIVGALYQLGPMFTQSDASPFDDWLRTVETVCFPAGVVALALGRLFENTVVSIFGGVGVVVGIAIISVVLGRQVYTATVDYSPMLPRYGLAAVLGCSWAVVTGWAWLADPVSTAVRFGPSTIGSVLLFGAIGFVVVGTLYHVVPFLIWVHQYSDRIGYESVPMIDDLYDDRLERIDLGLLVLGTGALVVASLRSVPYSWRVGRFFLLAGIFVFCVQMGLIVVRHATSAVDPRTWVVSDR